MRSWRRAVLASCLVVSFAFGPSRVLAQPTLDQQALAATLFKEAKALLNSGRIPEACRKLEESERLDPSGGTLLNLAVCHEREGGPRRPGSSFATRASLPSRARAPIGGTRGRTHSRTRAALVEARDSRRPLGGRARRRGRSRRSRSPSCRMGDLDPRRSGRACHRGDGARKEAC